MRVFKTRLFGRWADKEGMTDAALRQAVEELAGGLVDADLGGVTSTRSASACTAAASAVGCAP